MVITGSYLRLAEMEECLICQQETRDFRVTCVPENGIAHRVCVACFPVLVECPFDRRPIFIDDNPEPVCGLSGSRIRRIAIGAILEFGVFVLAVGFEEKLDERAFFITSCLLSTLGLICIISGVRS